MAEDWLAWHRPYDDPGSALQRRLAVVQHHVRRALDARRDGRIQVVSVCAGQGRDLLGALADHPRRDDVAARLVELDPRNVARARRAAADLGLAAVDIVEGDASSTSAYEGSVPADVVLVCGVFGNIADDDVRSTIDELPTLCSPGATVIWTRFPREADLLARIDRWFQDAGFELVAMETGEGSGLFGVGVHRLRAPPRPWRPGVRLFTFLEAPDAAGTDQDGGVARARFGDVDAGRPPTRERVLDAAWQLFVGRGFDGTTVTEIEAAAGLSAGSGSFYRHFASKDDVLRAAVDREVERIDAARELPPSSLAGDARLGLALDFQRRLTNLRRMQPLIAVLSREERHLGPSTRRVYELLVERNVGLRAEVLERWMDQGAVPRRDPQTLATVIVSALTGYHFARAFFGESPAGIEESTFVGTLAELVLAEPGDQD